jgi:hypothetical protein
MSAILTHDCPFCGTRSVAFSTEGKWAESIKLDSEKTASVLLRCGNCGRGALARFALSPGAHWEHFQRLERADYANSYENLGYRLVEFHPSSGTGEAPPHTPPRVMELYKQASSNLHNRNWDASGAMSRKCLDVATKLISRERLPDSEKNRVVGLWLKARIEALAASNLLTTDIAGLATLIKDGGDDASHDEDPYTEDEARRLLEFTEVLLTYVFTVPGMVEAARSPTEGGKNGS